MTVRFGLLALIAVSAAPGAARAARQPLLDGAATQFAAFAPLDKGWTAANNALVGDSPDYYSLPDTARGDFGDDPWTYYTIHPVDLWRNAVAGETDWTNYTVDCTLTVTRPAPTHGFRGGITFYNYQWGREAVGTDAAVIVRYQGPDDYYAVRLSTGFHHLELWKTHGGVVQVKPYDFAPDKPYRLEVTAAGPWIRASVDGKPVLSYCDEVDPLLHGKAGIGVRESRTLVSAFKVLPADDDTRRAPRHRADFHVREWVGKKYIFDGDEPIAWIYWNNIEGMQLREVKLLPGLMPLVLPSIGLTSYQYDGKGDLKILRDGPSFAFSAHQRGKGDAFECDSDWTLAYLPDKGYVWDKKVRFTALKDKAEPDLQIDDPFFYQMVAPQTTKLPRCRTVPNYCVYDRNDGKLIAFPSAHHLWTDGLGEPNCKPAVIRPDGFAVPTVDGWGVAMQLPKDNPRLHIVGFCHWGLDFHIRVQDNPVLNKGETYQGHLIYSLWDRDRVRAHYAQGTLPEPVKPNAAELFNNVEPVNHLQDLSPGLTGESVRLWTGKYTVDHTTGHGDSICMRIDAKDIKNRIDGPYDDDRPNVWLGPSYWTGPYLAQRYRFGMWVKADHFTGKVELRANDFNFPAPRKLEPFVATLPINGKCDWTYVSFEATFPREVYNWETHIDAIGDGVVWIDDIELTPLPTAIAAAP